MKLNEIGLNGLDEHLNKSQQYGWKWTDRNGWKFDIMEMYSGEELTESDKMGSHIVCRLLYSNRLKFWYISINLHLWRAHSTLNLERESQSFELSVKCFPDRCT